MSDTQLWKEAQEIAAREYETETGSYWEDADSYEREDWVFSVYMRLKKGGH